MYRGGGGGGNMQQMLRQAQKMQQKMEEDIARAQENLGQMTVQASAGGGAVKAVVSGNRQLLSLEIDPAAVDPADVEMLQDLLLAAVNEALRQAEELIKREMEKATGNVKLPF